MSTEDLRRVVVKIEERFRADDRELARRLMAAYDAAVDRIGVDAPDEREELLSRVGALMLIQEFLG